MPNGTILNPRILNLTPYPLSKKSPGINQGFFRVSIIPVIMRRV